MDIEPTTSPADDLPDDTDSPTEQPHIVASWLVRVHARGEVEVPTIAEVQSDIRGTLEGAYEGLIFTVYAERSDR